MIGLGSTLGIVAQFLILVPYLGRAGFHFGFRADFRGTGLGHTLRLGIWTVLFVIVNQIAYLDRRPPRVERHRRRCRRLWRGTRRRGHGLHDLLLGLPHHDGPALDRHRVLAAILPRLSARAAEGDLPGLART